MKDYKENRCRCCIKVFCCKKCRVKHENNEHGIFPDCDICLYGKAVLTNASENLMQHVKFVHWPLRCHFCKRFFGSTDELKKHSKCPVGLKIEDLQKSPYTPGQSHNESVYDSPPLSLLLKDQQPNKNPNMFSNLATSTPMQRGVDNNLLEQIQEVLTPVDYSENDDNKENAIKAKQDSDNASLKRKVTFCETPMAEIAENYRKHKGAFKKKQLQEKDQISSGRFSGSGSSSMFYSVKEEPQEENQSIEINNSRQQKLPTIIVEGTEENKLEDKENMAVKQDSTLWISAMNVSTSDNENKLDISPDHNISPSIQAIATPMVTKLKKRQVNIVMPTPIAKNSEGDIAENVKADTKIDQSSTPHLPHTSSSNQFDTNIPDTISEISLNTMQSRLWMSVSRLIRNVTGAIQIQSVSSIDENIPYTLKRRSSDFDSIDCPPIKRYKLTDIKCRRTIRELSNTETSWEVNGYSYSRYKSKTYVDKATQTDESFPLLEVHKTN